MPAAADVDALMAEHRPWVRELARNLRARLPKRVRLDDLIAAGDVGLWQSAERWTADGGASFKTFAARRVLGEMSDWLRKADFICPRMRQRQERHGRTLPTVRQFREPEHRVRNGDRGRSDHESAVPAPRAAPALDGRDAFERMIRGLPAESRHVMTLVYREGLTLKEAGRAIGFSESRAHQLRSEALATLREQHAA